jgi:hypothetical protein
VVAVVVVVLASLLVVFYPQDMPGDTILSATTVEAPVGLANNRNDATLDSTDEGLYLKRDDGAAVKIQLQGAAVESFSPTHRRPSQ